MGSGGNVTSSDALFFMLSANDDPKLELIDPSK